MGIYNCKLTHLDLFAGIGGVSLGLKHVAQTKEYCEINPITQQVLIANFNKHLSAGSIHGDVNTLVPKETYNLTSLSFPCKGLSTAGQRRGFEQKDTRQFFSAVEVLKNYRSPLLFIENVPGVLGSIDVIKKNLSLLGYNFFWVVVRSRDAVGAPHHRDRWYGLGVHESHQSLIPIKPYEKFNFSTAPVLRTNKAICAAESNCRVSMLGNAVVPSTVAYAWNLLGYMANLILFDFKAEPAKMKGLYNYSQTTKREGFFLTNFKNRFFTVKDWHSFALINNTNKFFTHKNLIWPVSDPLLKFNQTLFFSNSFYYKDKTPEQLKQLNLKAVLSPVYRTTWATPVYSCRPAQNALTERTLTHLYSQIKYEYETVDRDAPVDPTFIEWMMGYPTNYTFLESCHWVKEKNTFYKFS